MKHTAKKQNEDTETTKTEAIKEEEEQKRGAGKPRKGCGAGK